jgi:SAM-dependent methyltransferase
MNIRPNSKQLEYYYSAEYEPYQLKKHDNKKNKFNIFFSFKLILKIILKKYFRKFFISKALALYDAIPRSTVFVDFGCGSGSKLDQMRIVGCNTVGVDFSTLVIDGIRSRGHEAYLEESFWNLFHNSSADFVRMNHVVEHLYKPKEILRGIASKLKQNGTLHVAVPNPSGISAFFFRNNWHGLECPRHIILYPSETLVKLLSEAGFDRFEIIQETISKDFVRSFGYWLASHKLYNIDKVNGLMHSTFLALVFWLPMKIVALFGYSDRYHVVCYKK